MSSRLEQLSQLQNYIKDVDKEVTMILQSLQWDRKRLLQFEPKTMCKYDSNHTVPPQKLKEHEYRCALKSQGYAVDDRLLPDVFDADANTVLKLNSANIIDIINYASKTDPVFKRGDGNVTSDPLTFERIQASYTADERRAIYDVVISSRPACDEFSDLTITGQGAGSTQSHSTQKSKMELLAELRDMRRRRAKYRVAARSTNYSHTLKGVIESQMEMLTEAQGHIKPITHNLLNSGHRKIKEEPSDNPLDSKITEHRDFTKEKRNMHDGDHRNLKYTERRNYSDKKRVDDTSDYNTRKLQKDRRKYSTEDRKEYDNNDRKSRLERNRESYKEEINSRKYDKERVNIKEERDRHSVSSRDSSRHRERERVERYYKDRNRYDDGHTRDRSEHKRYIDARYIKKEKEDYHTERERRHHKNKYDHQQ